MDRYKMSLRRHNQGGPAWPMSRRALSPLQGLTLSYLQRQLRCKPKQPRTRRLLSWERHLSNTTVETQNRHSLTAL